MGRILFLGTGGVFGVPIWNCGCKVCVSSNLRDKRFRSSVLIETNGKKILIDFGPDIRSQFLKFGIKNVDVALLTHAHGDHMFGYSELSRQDDLFIGSGENVLEDFFKRMGSDGKRWFFKRNSTIKIEPFSKKEINGFDVETVLLEHKKDYGVNTPCNGFIFRSENFSFAYLTDYNDILETEKIQDLDLIISDGTKLKFGDKGHISIVEALELLNDFNPKKIIFTHITHDHNHKFLTDFVSKYENVEIAYDGKEILF
jgi:phosphoribosyl 1,2-cyclic phosphate phosphodiesterase